MDATSPAVERGESHPSLGLGLPEFLAGSTRAACAEHNPELWFSLAGGGAATDRAKEICQGCPLLRPCTAWALTNPVHGIWGGLTRSERRALQRKFGLPVRVPYEPGEKAVDVESEES